MIDGNTPPESLVQDLAALPGSCRYPFHTLLGRAEKNAGNPKNLWQSMVFWWLFGYSMLFMGILYMCTPGIGMFKRWCHLQPRTGLWLCHNGFQQQARKATGCDPSWARRPVRPRRMRSLRSHMNWSLLTVMMNHRHSATMRAQRRECGLERRRRKNREGEMQESRCTESQRVDGLEGREAQAWHPDEWASAGQECHFQTPICWIRSGPVNGLPGWFEGIRPHVFRLQCY